MTPEQKNILDRLEDKIRKLITQYTVLQKRCDDSDAQVRQLRSENEQLRSRAQQLEKKLDYLKTANAIHAREDNQEAKMKMGRLVREIEKCIALLNSEYE